MNRLVIFSAALLASLSSAPALAAGDPAQGLAALGKYNVITLGDFATAGHVHGTTLVGGSLTASNAVLGADPSSATTPVLTVYGDAAIPGSQNIGNNKNIFVGGNLTTGANFNGSGPFNLVVGGNLSTTSNLNFNYGSSDVVLVGGNLSGTGNVNPGPTFKVGGTVSGVNGSGITAGLGSFLASAVSTTRAAVTQVGDDVKALSTYLAGLTANASGSLSGSTLTLGAGAGYTVYSLTASDLNSLTQIDLAFGSASGPVVINVALDTAFNDFANFINSSSAYSSQVIWNFTGTADINLNKQFDGTILATGSKVSVLNNDVWGTVVAKSLYQPKGEIHVASFTGDLPPAVPEPASWALMIGGFALAGATLRRRKAGIAFA